MWSRFFYNLAEPLSSPQRIVICFRFFCFNFSVKLFNHREEIIKYITVGRKNRIIPCMVWTIWNVIFTNQKSDFLGGKKKTHFNKTKAFSLLTTIKNLSRPKHKYPFQYCSEVCTEDSTYSLLFIYARQIVSIVRNLYSLKRFTYISKTVINFLRSLHL